MNTQFRLPQANTRFALPIICPTTGEQVSAETLYNRCCDATGRVVRDHIGDLVLDNLQYPPSVDGGPRGYDENALCAAVYAWSDGVYKLLPERDTLMVGQKISIDDDYGSETFVVSVYAETLLELRRYVRENNPGSIPIYSDYDCTGLVCGQWAKFIKIYKSGHGYTALVEFCVSRDV